MKFSGKNLGIGLAGLLSALGLAGCASTDAALSQAADAQVQAKPLTAQIRSISKFGNCSLELTPQALTEAGYAAGDLLLLAAGGKQEEMPYGTNYSDVEHGKALVLDYNGDIQVAVNMGSFAKTYGLSEGDKVSISLAKKAGYLKKYKIRQLKKSENREDYASDEIFANFREVKAGNIAAKRLYRGCNPSETDARAPYADALAKKAGVQVVVNLADTEEYAASHFATAPYYAFLAEKGNVIFLYMGVSFTDPDFIARLRNGLVFLSQHKEGPYMVHCKEGKDRAGFVNALLEALCGATLAEMTQDYMLSFENYFGVQKGTEQYALISQTIPDMFKTMNGGKPVTDKNVCQVAQQYVLETVGLSKEQLSALCAVLTD